MRDDEKKVVLYYSEPDEDYPEIALIDVVKEYVQVKRVTVFGNVFFSNVSFWCGESLGVDKNRCVYVKKTKLLEALYGEE